MVSLRHMIGQMLIMGFPGYELSDNSPVVNWLQKDSLGGVILFDYDFEKKQHGKNLKNQEQIIHLNQQLNEYSSVNMQQFNLPLFICIDYEGGAVDRLATIAGCMQTKTALEQASLSDDALFTEAEKMALTLKKLGFNLNFAPVVDLNSENEKGIIGKFKRSFSDDPKCVARAAKLVVKAFKKHGVIPVYKHFPGHGSATGDTHEGFVDVTDTYHPQELEPYATLLADEQGVMVMTAHVINRHLDSSGLPATLSFAILTELLRQELNYDGVIVSDDIQMHAISNHYSLDAALQLTINAGADMLIFGNQLGSHTATEVIDKIQDLIASGAIQRARIEDAYQRIVKLKQLQFTVSTEASLN